jgi:hypothetical protein
MAQHLASQEKKKKTCSWQNAGIINDCDSDIENYVIRRRQNKTACPFLDYVKSDNSDDDSNDI